MDGNIRVSLGSAIVLGLIKGKIDVNPTTAYLLTYRNGKCIANCSFCPQAKSSKSRADMLSRIVWPTFPMEKVFKGLRKAIEKNLIKRVCIQSLNYPNFLEDIIKIVNGIKDYSDIPISISCQPIDKNGINELKKIGIERISIPLDAATKEIFNKVKGYIVDGPYFWEKQIELLINALEIFGKGYVNTHLIVGLGEKEKEMIKMIQWCNDLGIYPSMFAFTPIPGTKMENIPPPNIEKYRRIQIAHYLIINKISNFSKMEFNNNEEIINFGIGKGELIKIIHSGKPFLTTGCPNCNRPYYNENPRGPIYNYPRKIEEKEIHEIMKQLNIF
ncbi:MAG: radical SAM protein [Nitrososphaerota archaeon]